MQYVTPPGTHGAIGMTACPGRRAQVNEGGDWLADFSADLQKIALWQPQLVIALLGEPEFQRPRYTEFEKSVTAANLPWEYSPVGNYGVPDEAFMARWRELGAKARAIVRGGGRVLLHCRYGLGRTGLVAGMLLIEFGMDAVSAIAAVRNARPNTIQNETQMRFLLDYKPNIETTF